MENELSNILDQQTQELSSMESITAEVFATLRLDKEEFLRSLHDESLYTKDEWTSLQRNRAMLEGALEKRFLKTKKMGTAQQTLLVQPHWIAVR
jgi:hypothetical protein